MSEEVRRTPKLRFPGFTEDWEQRKLGEVAEYKNGIGHEDKQKDTGEFELINLNSISLGGELKSSGRFIDSLEETLLKDDLVMILSDIARGNLIGRVALIPQNNKYILNQRVARLRIVSNVEAYFLFLCINQNQSYFKFKSAGMSQLNISRENVEKFAFFLPILKEQKQIGAFFSVLNQTITIHRRKCEDLKELKKGLLQKMFPREGEEYPEVRFPGFTDAWKQRKLGELMNVKSVKRIHQVDWSDSGVRFLRARDIVAIYKNEELSDCLYISKEKYDEYSTISGKVKRGDLLVTGVGSIGVPMLINSEKPLYFKDGNIIWFQNEEAIDGDFLYYSFCGSMIQSFIQETSGSGTVGTYTIDSGKKTPVVIPTDKMEQVKIGEFFKYIDRTITLHQRKADDLEELKRGLLQQMFV